MTESATPLRLDYARRLPAGAPRDWRFGAACLGLLVAGLALFAGGLAGMVHANDWRAAFEVRRGPS